ncbi:MAG: hypothetical protein OXH59_08275 [Rhodospirillaceae bacterium]|nr:hypothetical protein [Rhodospirillaceae bacterium]
MEADRLRDGVALERGDAAVRIAKTLQLRFPGRDFERLMTTATNAVRYQRGRRDDYQQKATAFIVCQAYLGRKGGIESGKTRRRAALRRWRAWRKLHRAGYSTSYIADRYGVSRAAVRKGLRSLWAGGGTEALSPASATQLLGASGRYSLRETAQRRRGRRPNSAKPTEKTLIVRRWVSAETVRRALRRLGRGRFTYSSVDAVRRWGLDPADRPTDRSIAIQYRRDLADVRLEATMPASLDDDPWEGLKTC